MPLQFHPEPGTILVCDFSTGFLPPEMVKRRPVVVISPRLRRRDNLCTVVPLSTSEPQHIMPYHHQLEFSPLLPDPWSSPKMWVKCDMISTVSFSRLNLIRNKRVRGQGRTYLKVRVPDADFEQIKQAVLHGLGINIP
ncbi:MAG: type II toxin-antitoxin system PemK/MazF family toxin [Alphaproteobacteria bacterium]|nr:type II toxin-antitoxin system PemK/MazF family toxin [Alphaproteobacteria bacterium]